MASPGGQTEAQSAIAPALYQLVKAGAAPDEPSLARDLGVGQEELAAAWTELRELGLVKEAPDGDLSLVDPEAALLRLLEEQRRYMNLHSTWVDRGMWAVESLVGRYRHTMDDEQANIEIEMITDGARIHRLLDDLVDLVQGEVASLHPGPLPPTEVLRAGLDRDRLHVERGVRVRTIYPQRFANIPYIQAHLRDLVDIGTEVRLAHAVPLHLILGDGRIAALPIDPEQPEKGIILVRGAALVRSYAALYEYCWHTGSVLASGQDPNVPESDATGQQQAVVRLLASGMKDEQIARHLGISLRTMSRTVSEAMQQLGAGSRFQAGARARELGWLD